MDGRLVLVATPIGNLEDLSDRARRELSEAESWIVEDTRVSGRLQTVLGVKKPMRVLNEHSHPRQVAALVELARTERTALLTDAGSPAVSDPGTELVDLCLDEGIEVDAVPGPSAVTTALALAGFFAQRFVFLGFLARKPGQVSETLRPFADSTMTVVLFESPHRVDKTLEACARDLGSRRYALCRELTKMHQQVWRGTLPGLPSSTDVPRKGEFTIVVEGKRKGQDLDRTPGV
ncbi:MAG: 16S rRNA (cytidine(1402)-2'-O)-methyltransferase [Armatimonadetes bacterium]|nr:16S rRNA (cytidine(1402)-2'-O)-methyltransferase [Armatimonadota bacterium]